MSDIDLSRFQDADGNWLQEDEWPYRRMVFVCHGKKCRINGIPVTAVVAENVDGIVRAVCGPCGRMHTDITDLGQVRRDEH